MMMLTNTFYSVGTHQNVYMEVAANFYQKFSDFFPLYWKISMLMMIFRFWSFHPCFTDSGYPFSSQYVVNWKFSAWEDLTAHRSIDTVEKCPFNDNSEGCAGSTGVYSSTPSLFIRKTVFLCNYDLTSLIVSLFAMSWLRGVPEGRLLYSYN